MRILTLTLVVLLVSACTIYFGDGDDTPPHHPAPDAQPIYPDGDDNPYPDAQIAPDGDWSPYPDASWIPPDGDTTPYPDAGSGCGSGSGSGSGSGDPYPDAAY